MIIRDANSNVLEQGEAVQSEADGWWDYATTTTMSMPSGPILEATAEDLPGNAGTLSID